MFPSYFIETKLQYYDAYLLSSNSLFCHFTAFINYSFWLKCYEAESTPLSFYLVIWKINFFNLKQTATGSIIISHLYHCLEYLHSFAKYLITLPYWPKCFLISSSGVSGSNPPTKTFFTGSLPPRAFALFGSMFLPCNVCVCSFTTYKEKSSQH